MLLYGMNPVPSLERWHPLGSKFKGLPSLSGCVHHTLLGASLKITIISIIKTVRVVTTLRLPEITKKETLKMIMFLILRKERRRTKRDLLTLKKNLINIIITIEIQRNPRNNSP
jgi:hypothetical protein